MIAPPRSLPSATVPATLWMVLLSVLCAACDEGAGPSGGQLEVHGNLLPADRHAEDQPSLSAAANGDLWVACQVWGADGDGIELGLLTDWEDGERLRVYDAPAHLLGTALALRGDDALQLVWSEQMTDGWAVRGLDLPPGPEAGTLGEPGEVLTLASRSGSRLLMPRLCADGDGRLLLVWMQMDRDGSSIRARLHRVGAGWGPEVVVSGAGTSHWSPALTVVGPGRFAVAWDSAVDADFDVLFARLELDATGALEVTSRQRLTDTTRYEAKASIAAAGERLYIAYEVGDEGWGREGSTNKLHEALHYSRRLEIRAVDGDTVAPLAVPFMDGVSPGLKGGCEQPRLLVDGNGNLMLFFRGLTLLDAMGNADDPNFQRHVQQRQGAGVGWRTSIWFEFASRFDGERWELEKRHQLGLDGSNGRCDAPLALGDLPRGGVAYAVVGDGRVKDPVLAADGSLEEGAIEALSWWKPVTDEATLVSVGRIQKGPPVGPLAVGPSRPLPPLERDAVPPQTAPDASLPARRLPDGRSLQLALGDVHRHTDLSRCSSNWDGPFEDAVRYAYDAGQLQFLAITDHFEHMNRYDWWRSLANADAFHVPGRMVNLRAYERADAQTGHRNVISGGDALPLVAYRNTYRAGRDDARANAPRALWEHLGDDQLITIPHTTAGMYEGSVAVFDWLSFNPEYDRVVEIFQGYRGSSEEAEGPRAIPSRSPNRFARNALDGGLHFGFVASSDHQSSYGSFAGAWTTGLTRAEVFEAMHARRTFAATARMSLWAEWDGVPMGASRRGEPSPRGQLRVDVDLFGRELKQLELVVDGAVVESREVSGSVLSELFDSEFLGVPADTTRYAYVRLTTVDGELGWTSPIRRGGGALAGSDGPLGEQAFDDETGPALQLPFPSAAHWHGGHEGDREH